MCSITCCHVQCDCLQNSELPDVHHRVVFFLCYCLCLVVSQRRPGQYLTQSQARSESIPILCNWWFHMAIGGLQLATLHVVRTGAERWEDTNDTGDTRTQRTNRNIFLTYILSLWDAGTPALHLGYPGGGTRNRQCAGRRCGCPTATTTETTTVTTTPSQQ
jgi:hypothetical protein